VIVVAVVGTIAAFRRSAEYVERRESTAAGGTRSPRTGGMPVAGEGDGS
jgi:hypothetical protein